MNPITEGAWAKQINYALFTYRDDCQNTLCVEQKIKPLKQGSALKVLACFFNRHRSVSLHF